MFETPTPQENKEHTEESSFIEKHKGKIVLAVGAVLLAASTLSSPEKSQKRKISNKASTVSPIETNVTSDATHRKVENYEEGEIIEGPKNLWDLSRWCSQSPRCLLHSIRRP